MNEKYVFCFSYSGEFQIIYYELYFYLYEGQTKSYKTSPSSWTVLGYSKSHVHNIAPHKSHT